MIVILFSVENAPLFITIDLDYNDFNLQQKEKKENKKREFINYHAFFFPEIVGSLVVMR